MANSPLAQGPDRPPPPAAAGASSEPERAAPASAPGQKETAPEPVLPLLFVTNLLAILAFGVAISAWMLYYTEWFPAIGGLLALGGVVSWLAFVSRILSDERMKGLQGWADRAILCSRITLTVLVLLTVAGLVTASFLGAVQVESVRESADRFLRVDPADSPPGGDVRLRAGHAVRKLVWTSWWKPTAWRVKVSGYPDEVVTVRPWRRESLSVPASFQRPVVLLRPTVDLFDAVHNSPRRISVRVTFPKGPSSSRTPREFRTQPDGQPLKFDGRSLWIGCDEDVDIPLRLEAAWRAELSASQRSSLINYWLRPRALTGERVALVVGTEIQVTLFDLDGNKSEQEFVVRKQSDFLQEEKLDLPR
jgi:hypothetical protein